MNTNQLKKFAKEARIKLLDQVGRKLDFVLAHDTAELRGKENEITQLKNKIQQEGKEQVIEMVAYTWFNRLMALRFMDANSYTIPKVVTPLLGMSNPEILQNALGGNIEADLQLNRQRLNDLLDGKTAATDAHTEAYKMLLVASCNQWHVTMPFMFERISDYTELLLPDDLLSDYSIVADIRNGMSDEDCQQEELIGWLYQFYIADEKGRIDAKKAKKQKVEPFEIPAATQLFTPRWIVRYMTENTLGKLWINFKAESKLREYMPFYIEDPKTKVSSQIPDGIKSVTDITFLDPCLGSGHVLVYAFELLTKIYEEEGYNTNEIPSLILENNLFGIDIDQRAAQLAAFALAMKARSYYSRYFRKPVQPNVIWLENVSDEIIQQSIRLPVIVNGKKILRSKDLSLHLLSQVNNFGSLVKIEPEEANACEILQGNIWQEKMKKLKQQASFLSREYNCVVTNPPYLGSDGMNKELKSFTEKNFKKSKSDLMSCFIERCLAFTCKRGSTGMITQHSWMFINSYEELRPFLIDNFQFESMMHLGPRTFPEISGEVVQNTAFVLCNNKPKHTGHFIRLTEFNNPQLKEDKALQAMQNPTCEWFYTVNQKEFEKIPGAAFAYWVSEKIRISFDRDEKVGNVSELRQGIATGDNDRFLRFWHEIDFSKIGFNCSGKEELWKNKFDYAPYNKGGSYRKWYGNNEYVIKFNQSNYEILKSMGNHCPSEQYYFKDGATWSALSSSKLSVRRFPKGFIFSDKGQALFANGGFNMTTIISFLNSNICDILLRCLTPTLDFQSGYLRKLPIKDIELTSTERLIEIAKSDWDSYEVSWNFISMPLLQHENREFTLIDTYKKLRKVWEETILEMQKLEEENNYLLITSFDLQDEVTVEVPIKDITLTCNPSYRYGYNKDNLELELLLRVDTIKDLISFAIGCIFGRYDLNKPGLVLASQGESLKDFLKQVANPAFMPDEDNILPLLDGEWFADDIVGRFKSFLKAAYIEEHFEVNFKYIEETIGKDIRKYFLKDFYTDHIKRYRKRPIYWMFSSPKGHFKALIYMHRYQPDLCSKLLNDYLQNFIGKLEAKKQNETRLSLREDISVREKTAAIKEIDKLDVMLKDCQDYGKTLFNIATQKISIDLDDGVKVNYQKFKEVLVPIKGLEKDEE